MALKKVLNQFVAVGLSVLLSTAAFAGDLSGKFMAVAGHEDVGGGASFAPMPNLRGSLTANHGKSFLWESTTFRSAFNATTQNNKTMFQAGAGLKPREARVTFKGIGGCTDLSGGLFEPVNYSPSRAWELDFYGLTPPSAAEDIPTFQNLITQSLIGGALKHRFHCKRDGNAILDVALFKVAPKSLRKIYGQGVDPLPTKNIVGGSDTLSIRVDARNKHILGSETSIGYGGNFTHLQAGETTSAQTTYLAHTVFDHSIYRVFFEGGYAKNLKGNPKNTGTYLYGYAQAVFPTPVESIKIPFSVFAAKNVVTDFLGKEVYGAETGFEWKAYEGNGHSLSFATKGGLRSGGPGKKVEPLVQWLMRYDFDTNLAYVR